jgi:hypothetical protein
MVIIAGTPIEIETNRDGLLWFAQNGAKRTRLSLYAAQGVHIECVDSNIPVYVARDAVPVWYSPDWREASVYLQPAEDEELYVVWLNSHCGFDVIPQAAEKHAAWSYGGPKNSASKLAILAPPCYVQIHTYKHSSPRKYAAVTLDGAVRWLGTRSEVIAAHFRRDLDATRLAEFQGWLSELTTAGQLEVQDE